MACRVMWWKWKPFIFIYSCRSPLPSSNQSRELCVASFSFLVCPLMKPSVNTWKYNTLHGYGDDVKKEIRIQSHRKPRIHVPLCICNEKHRSHGNRKRRTNQFTTTCRNIAEGWSDNCRQRMNGKMRTNKKLRKKSDPVLRELNVRDSTKWSRENVSRLFCVRFFFVGCRFCISIRSK